MRKSLVIMAAMLIAVIAVVVLYHEKKAVRSDSKISKIAEIAKKDKLVPTLEPVPPALHETKKFLREKEWRAIPANDERRLIDGALVKKSNVEGYIEEVTDQLRIKMTLPRFKEHKEIVDRVIEKLRDHQAAFNIENEAIAGDFAKGKIKSRQYTSKMTELMKEAAKEESAILDEIPFEECPQENCPGHWYEELNGEKPDNIEGMARAQTTLSLSVEEFPNVKKNGFDSVEKFDNALGKLAEGELIGSAGVELLPDDIDAAQAKILREKLEELMRLRALKTFKQEEYLNSIPYAERVSRYESGDTEEYLNESKKILKEHDEAVAVLFSEKEQEWLFGSSK